MTIQGKIVTTSSYTVIQLNRTRTTINPLLYYCQTIGVCNKRSGPAECG